MRNFLKQCLKNYAGYIISLTKDFFTLRSRAAHLAKVKKKEAIKQINLNLYQAQS
ncbi:MAG: hypothetical protein ACN6NI_00280 [Acinetobacter sp.]